MSELADEIAGARETALFELLRQRLVREIAVPAPAVGVDWTITVPSGALWEVLSVQETLATSAVVANRTASLRANDQDGVMVWRIAPAAVVAASAAVNVTFLAGLGDHYSVSNLQSALPAPPMQLPAGWALRAFTSSLDAGDQYSAIVLTVREWSVTAVRTNLHWLEEHYR